jgi:hypothetical protein
MIVKLVLSVIILVLLIFIVKNMLNQDKLEKELKDKLKEEMNRQIIELKKQIEDVNNEKGELYISIISNARENKITEIESRNPQTNQTRQAVRDIRNGMDIEDYRKNAKESLLAELNDKLRQLI